MRKEPAQLTKSDDLCITFFLSEAVAFRRVYGLESYSRTSGESNHHRQSVSDTRVPRYQLHHGDFFLSEPVAFRRVYGLESYSRTSGESNHHRQSVSTTRVTPYQLSHEGDYQLHHEDDCDGLCITVESAVWREIQQLRVDNKGLEQGRPLPRLHKACRFLVPKTNPLDMARCCF